MATLNGYYIHVTEESIDNTVTTRTHPTQEGTSLSDTIQAKPIVLDLSGKIVDTPQKKADELIKMFKEWQYSGNVLTYKGQCGKYLDLQIQSFSEAYNHRNYGGADFSMTLQQMKGAKASFANASNELGLKKTSVQQGLYEGATVTFKGGYVYVSSDAVHPAAKRGRSTCKITEVSTKAWSVHQYHLKSTDGRMVYGWVDKSTIETQISLSPSVSAGLQQTEIGNTGSLYHTVKSGDTLYRLVTKTYKHLNLSITDLIKNNPNAFSVKGDPTTLKIGARLKLK